MISCLCGYRGAGIADGASLVCPICRTPAAAAAQQPPASTPTFAPPPPPAAGGLRMPPPPGAGPVAVSSPARAPARHDGPGPAAAIAPPLDGRSSGGILRIPCPNGHVLKTKRGMLGQQVVCPECNEFFVLEETDSLEYKREEAKRKAHEDEKRAEKWLWRAIYAAVFVVLSFIVMAVIGSNPQWFR